MNTIEEAQNDLRTAYDGGATGAVCSATAWLAAAVVAWTVTPVAGVWTLVFGGMLIFPASVLLSKALGRSGQHDKQNPLASLAMEGTVWMLLSIVLALGLSLHRVDWFFPAMLLVIGGRYLTFKTLYGMKLYWVFGGTLAAAGFALGVLAAPASLGALAGALIEYGFGLAIFLRQRAASTRQADST